MLDFRPEVLANKQYKQYGKVFINIPTQYLWVSVAIIVFLIAIALATVWIEWTERYTVAGYINSEPGLNRIYAIRSGIISKLLVHEGDNILKASPICWLDTSQEGVNVEHTLDELELIKRRKKMLLSQLANKKQLLTNLHDLWVKQIISTLTYQRHQDEVIALKANLNQINRSIAHYKHAQSYVLYAPLTGLVSHLMVQEGDYVNASKLIMTLVPEHATLMANLFIPVDKIRQLKPGDRVVIQYDAYPYQQFGSQNALIKTISKTSLTDAEQEDKPLKIGQPYYKATALLVNDGLNVYSKERVIRYGMTFSAIIQGQKKTLWKWIIDPLVRHNEYTTV